MMTSCRARATAYPTKAMLEDYAEKNGFTGIRHFTDDADIIGLNQKTFDLRGFTD